MIHIRTKTNYCEKCHELLDAGTALNGNSPPKKGSISICAYCANIAQYDENLHLTTMSERELAIIKVFHPDDYELIMEAAGVVKEMIASKN